MLEHVHHHHMPLPQQWKKNMSKGHVKCRANIRTNVKGNKQLIGVLWDMKQFMLSFSKNCGTRAKENKQGGNSTWRT